MYYSGVSTSLMLIVTGAILAFAVNAHVSGINVNGIGWILLVVGILGLLLSFALLGDFEAWPRRRRYPPTRYIEHDDYPVTPPHEHRRVETRDVVYDEDGNARVERVRTTRRPEAR